MFEADVWPWVLRLSLAAVAGAVIGGERESRGHPAGVRTQALVALTACLLTTVGKLGFEGSSVDFSRIASTVVAGIGFIGGGVILKHRGTVTGLTTAATLFLSAGIGIAIGADLIVPALLATAIALIVIYGLRLIKPLLRSRAIKSIQVDYIQGHGTFGPLIHSVQDSGGVIQDLQVDDEVGPDGSLRHITIQVVIKGDESVFEREMDRLLARPEVKDVTVLDL